MFTGFRTIDGVTYYFGSNGAMRTGWIRIPGVIYKIDGTRGDAWCYANASGAIQFGWQKLGGKWYYFEGSCGYMCTGRRKIDDKWYTFDENGALIS
jgi:glucan-binding YG repeat protein